MRGLIWLTEHKIVVVERVRYFHNIKREKVANGGITATILSLILANMFGQLMFLLEPYISIAYA